jgi:hypothetical protein
MAEAEHGIRTGLSALGRDAAVLSGIVLCAASYGLGYAIRYRFVEPEAMGAACERGDPWWCPVRTGFIIFTQWNGFGWLALVLALVALAGVIVRVRNLAVWSGCVALVTAGLGLILYNTTMAAPAAILALLCLLRAGRTA